LNERLNSCSSPGSRRCLDYWFSSATRSVWRPLKMYL